MTESLEFAGLPLPLATIVLAILAAGIVVGYLRSLRGRSAYQRFLLLALRLGALACIVWLCLLPFWQRRRLEPVPPRIAILVDASPSMRLPVGTGTAQSRRELAMRTVEESARQPIQVELFSFSSILVRGFGAEGGVSRLHEALATLTEQNRSSELRAIVLLSDGRATDASAVVPSVPVYAVPLGPVTSKDLGIEAEALPAEVQPDQPVSIRGKVFRSDPSIDRATVELWSGSTQLESRDVLFPPESEEAQVEFDHVPDDSGLIPYRIVLRREAGAAAGVNDVAYLGTVATPSKQRILLVSSQPGFESAFLGRQLDAEADLEVVRAVQVPENRVLFGDGTTGGAELLEPLRRYAAVVASGSRGIASVEGASLAEYVQAGGGLVLLPSPDDVEALSQSEVAKLLPITPAKLELREGAFVVRVPSARGLHPLLSFLEELPGKRMEPEALPPLEWTFAQAEPRPGAQVLLETDADGDVEPILTVHRYGQGRVAVLSGGPIWNWRFQPVGLGSGKEELYIRLIPRIVRWAASGGEFEQFRLTARGRGVGEPLEVRLVQLEEDLTPAEGQDVSVLITRVEADGSETRVLETELRIGAGGGAQWSPILAEPGIYRVRAQFDQRTVSRDAAVALNYPAGELAFSSVALSSLEELSASSGGRVVPHDQLAKLYDELAGTKRSFRMLFEREPIWSNAALLLTCIGLLLTEWTLRRGWSLP